MKIKTKHQLIAKLKLHSNDLPKIGCVKEIASFWVAHVGRDKYFLFDNQSHSMTLSEIKQHLEISDLQLPKRGKIGLCGGRYVAHVRRNRYLIDDENKKSQRSTSIYLSPFQCGVSSYERIALRSWGSLQ